ncbi:LysR family transcriptional regulator [Xaviernesmea oryzae]|uniref:LysR family transcriptional regulator n=1 Tax=Xaviernesmea oryzae TaxID=464029 RepID=A0A1Q9ART8_9HYPH|nr:LysR family transcriptional regulator [Xaviernesmea oryzae]OLP58137.1 LysR family transcriptional regulator [Xaviernesmea oryzae]SEL81520.1 DNA-binding transcriptional regulator, LysR family [Xaviernesmea oryzae]
MKDLDWDHYRCFLMVAKKGGLSGAAAKLGMSAPTLGRRMLELEERLGRALFERSQTGYRLTRHGQELMEELQAMEAVARKVEGWKAEGEGKAVVRITLGTWIARLLSNHIGALVLPGENIRVEMTVGEVRASLNYRQSDIGIRAVEPDEGYLIARPAGRVAYAVYRRQDLDLRGARWIAVDMQTANSPYLRYPHEMVPDAIMATVNRPHALLDLVRAGAGQALLPCVVGDAEEGLERVGDLVAALAHQQWIVTNSEDRHRRAIRLVAQRMGAVLDRHRDHLAGRHPRLAPAAGGSG